MSGIESSGFVGKAAIEIKQEKDAAFKSTLGDSIGSEPDGSIPAASAIGQEIAIIVDAESSAWEVLGAIYAAFDPDQAVTPQLQALCALTGTFQREAANSTALITCAGVAGTVITAGSVVKVTDLLTPFSSDSVSPAPTLALVAGTWATSTAYAVNDLRKANGKVWQCTVAGTSTGGGGGPTGAVGSSQTDGTVTWYGVCVDTLGVALVAFTADEEGPLAAEVGTLVNIATPIDGWQTAYNTADATLGRDLESDSALRARRVLELQSSGGGPADAIRAAILEIDTVIACKVFVNNADVVNADGVPAHGVEVLILDSRAQSSATDQELAEAVWAAVGAGTATGGGISKTVVDDSGTSQTVKFSRPTPKPIYIIATVYYDPAVWTGSGIADAIEAGTQSALLTYAGSDAGTGYYQIGYDVRALQLASAVKDGPQATEFDASLLSTVPVIPAPDGSQPMAGITDVAVLFGLVDPPVASTTVTIGIREIATFATARITVNVSELAP